MKANSKAASPGETSAPCSARLTWPGNIALAALAVALLRADTASGFDFAFAPGPPPVAVSVAGEPAGTNLFTLAATNLTDWTISGVQGGIPTNFTTYTNFTTNTFSVAQLQAAINAASALGATNNLQLITFSDGAYAFGSDLERKNFVTLRGSGTNTVFTFTAKMNYSGQGYNRTANHVVGGVAARGATSLVLSNAIGANAIVGGIVVVTEWNNTNQASTHFVHSWGYESATTNFQGGYDENMSPSGWQVRGQQGIITSISGSTIGLSAPLASDFTNAARVEYIAGNITEWAGLENCKVVTRTDSQRTIEVIGAKNCWFKNLLVDVAGSEADAIMFYWAVHNTVTGSGFRGVAGHNTPTATRFSINSGLNRVEDNWFEHVAWANLTAGRAFGNVVAYNYCTDATNGSPGTQLTAAFWDHGLHPDFYLYEGNKAGKIHLDNIHGSGSRFLLFRNHFRGSYTNKQTSFGANAIALDEFHSWIMVVGNVLGWPGTNTGNVFSIDAANGDDASAALLAYNFSGYDKVSQGGQYARTRGVLHANWNVPSNAVQYAAGEVTGLTNSYLYRTRPAYFGNLAFPALGPDTTGVWTNLLPAEARHKDIPIP